MDTLEQAAQNARHVENKLPDLSEYSVYITEYWITSTDWRGRTITYKPFHPVRRRIS